MSKENIEKRKPIIAVGVLIFNSENKILMGERFSEFGKGMMALPGGKVGKNEVFIDTAIREVLEETGLSDPQIDFGNIISMVYENVYGLDGLTVGFIAKTKNEPKDVAEEEIGNWGWFDINKLPENIFLPSARIIENYKIKQVLPR